MWQALSTRRAFRTRHALACLLLGWTLAGSQYIDWERLDAVLLARIWYFAALDGGDGLALAGPFDYPRCMRLAWTAAKYRKVSPCWRSQGSDLNAERFL